MNTNQHPYNYQHYDLDVAAYGLNNDLSKGDSLAGLRFFDIYGESFHLGEMQGERVILETGSLSCPHFFQNSDAMDQLAERFSSYKFGVVYVREEHPGEVLTSHHHVEEKLERAYLLQKQISAKRKVIVDDIAGSAHKLLGGFPNMVYFCDENQNILFRENWNHPVDLCAVLSGLFCENPTDSETEIPAVSPEAWTTISTLIIAGPTAAFDYLKTIPKVKLSQWREKFSL